MREAKFVHYECVRQVPQPSELLGVKRGPEFGVYCSPHHGLTFCLI